VDEPFEMAVNPSTGKVYVTYYNTGQLSVITGSPFDEKQLPSLFLIIIGISAVAGVSSVIGVLLLRKQKIRKQNKVN